MSTSISPRFKTVMELLHKLRIQASVLLDLGCADGSLTIEMARAVQAREVYGVDINAKALEVARSRNIKTIDVIYRETRYRYLTKA